MESVGQKAARLLTALDDLVGQEGMYLRGGYYDLAGQVRERAEPVVRELVSLAALPEVADYRPRALALIQRTAEHAAFLQDKIVELAAEIRRADQARFKVAQLAPAYARASGNLAPRFRAAG